MPDRPIPPECLGIIHEFEKGPSGSFAMTPYIDEGGLCIGWGHRIFSHADPLLHIAVDAKRADELAIADLAEAGRQVQFYLNVPDQQYPRLDGTLAAKLTDGQFGALCCFLFNVGAGRFAMSTVRGEIIDGNLDKVPDALAKWVYAKNKSGIEVKSAGLIARRMAEIELWNA